MMECLYAKCIPYITDCVMGELEKLGQKYKIALRIIKDPRFERLNCMHKGTYADDCLVNRVKQVSILNLYKRTNSLTINNISYNIILAQMLYCCYQ